MIHLLSRLTPGARVLDLGAAAGSFADVRSDIYVVRLDLKFDAPGAAGCLVRGDAARLIHLAERPAAEKVAVGVGTG